MSTMQAPLFSQSVEQSFTVEPLGGAHDVFWYLNQRFPEELYRYSHSSHLYRFMAAMLGPQGVMGLRQNYLEARIMLEERGMELFDLDSFFGNPLAFGRILEESFEDDPVGLIPHSKWVEIKAKNARYRNRALDFISGVRAGNTPEGMSLVAKAGLGHAVEIVENYKYLYNVHSDDPLDIRYYGKTLSTEEFVVLPRREFSQSEIQKVTITGIPVLPDSGTFYLSIFGETTSAIPYNASAFAVKAALETLPHIVPGDVEVTGGPGPLDPWNILFTGGLANRDVPELIVINSSLANTGDSNSDITIRIDTTIGGMSSYDEVVNIGPRDHFHLQEALFRIKPMTALPSVNDGRGLRQRQDWNSVHATSEYTRVVRYVRGSSKVAWPRIPWKSGGTPVFWIEKDIEHEAPRLNNDLQHHYQGFHNVSSVSAYTDEAPDSNYENDVNVTRSYASEHIGRFNLQQRVTFPFLRDLNDDSHTYKGNDALADYPSGPLLTRSSATIDDRPYTFVDGIYPLQYFDLAGVPSVQYSDNTFWASRERVDGDEYLELDLGKVQAVNFLSFDISRKPIQVEVTYDILDIYPQRKFIPVTPLSEYHNSVTFDGAALNPWETMNLQFTNAKGQIPFTRFIRLRFRRLSDPLNPFLFNPLNHTFSPWSIDVRDLIVGRNV